LGAGLQYDIGTSALNCADEFITHISAKGDFVSDLYKVHFVDFILQMALLRSPGNFGKRFTIPTAYKKSIETHEYPFGSLMKFLGKDIRTRPKDLPLTELVPFSKEQP